MYIGKMVKRSPESIVLVDAAWVSDTGRRHKFFAGEYDEHCEIEPCPDGARVELPATGAVITDWAHPLPREPR
jgi:hypothetical protein